MFAFLKIQFMIKCEKGAKRMSKKVKEIFSDYEARANIIEAEVSNFDVIKKQTH